MRIRSALFASVCTALLAASAAVPASAAAKSSPAVKTAKQAYESLVSGRSREAIALYAEAIESRELGAELLANSLLNRALAYQNIGQHAEAIDDYATALRVDALSAKLRAVALYNRGLSYQKISKPALAIEDFTNALFLDAEFAQAYYSRGNVLRRSGQYLFALSDYEKSLKYTHPEAHLPLYGTALTYEALRRPNEAQMALVQALTLKPDFMAAREKLTSLIQPDLSKASATPEPAPRPRAHAAGLQPDRTDDSLVTGSVLSSDPDLTVRKAELPAAVSPPSRVKSVIRIVPASAAPAPRAMVQKAVLTAPPVPDLPTTKEPSSVIEPAVERSKSTGWAVQISSQKQEDAAWSVWKKMQTRHSKILRRHEAAVQRADLGDRGIFFRLRVTGIADKGQAKKLCARLKRRGTACFVARTSS